MLVSCKLARKQVGRAGGCTTGTALYPGTTDTPDDRGAKHSQAQGSSGNAQVSLPRLSEACHNLEGAWNFYTNCAPPSLSARDGADAGAGELAEAQPMSSTLAEPR